MFFVILNMCYIMYTVPAADMLDVSVTSARQGWSSSWLPRAADAADGLRS